MGKKRRDAGMSLKSILIYGHFLWLLVRMRKETDEVQGAVWVEFCSIFVVLWNFQIKR